MRLIVTVLTACCMGGLLLGAAALPVSAATTYTVTRFDDPLPGTCDPGDCSLREALHAANTSVGIDTILLPAGNYNLTRTGSGDAREGDLDVSDGVVIYGEGPGSEAIIDMGLVSHRGFAVVGAHLTLVDVGVRRGRAPTLSNGSSIGGGIRIYANGRLTMLGGSITDSVAPSTGGDGGGAIANSGEMTLQRVRLIGNSVGFAFGGAILNHPGATATIEDSIITGNSSDGFGGAIWSRGRLTVSRSLLKGNSATDAGGGIYVGGCGEVELFDSTITGNRAGSAAGARVRDGSLRLERSTVTRNVAGAGGAVGGVRVRDTAEGCDTRLRLSGTILAGNSDNGGPGKIQQFRDCWDENLSGKYSSLILSQGYNLVGDGTGCGIQPANGDQIGEYEYPLDPKLAGLRFNGGLIRGLSTHALLQGSPAINGGDPGLGCETPDQRSAPRCMGGRADIGAYERIACRGILVNRVGTRGDDLPVGPLAPTSKRDGIIGLEGDDRLKGADGNDALCGGPGDDHLDGGAGTDACAGGPGIDQARRCEKVTGVP